MSYDAIEYTLQRSHFLSVVCILFSLVISYNPDSTWKLGTLQPSSKTEANSGAES